MLTPQEYLKKEGIKLEDFKKTALSKINKKNRELLDKLREHENKREGILNFYNILYSLVGDSWYYPERDLREKYLTTCKELLPPRGIVVDFGCGLGLDCTYFTLTREDLFVIGVDMSPVAARKAKSRAKRYGLKNIDTLVADFDHLPFQDESIDTGFSADSLFEYLFEVSEEYVLKRMGNVAKVLKKEGKLIIGKAGNPSEIIEYFGNSIGNYAKKIGMKEKFSTEFSYRSIEDGKPTKEYFTLVGLEKE